MSLYATSLPHGLLDLTFSRTCSPCLNIFRTATTSGSSLRRTRRMHSAALATLPPEPPVPMEGWNSANTGRGRKRRGLGGLAVRVGLDVPNTGLELEKRVRALEIAATEEEKSVTPMFYTEEDLMFLYEDLLAIPSIPRQPTVDLLTLDERQAELDAKTVLEAEKRLSQMYPGLPNQNMGANCLDGISKDVPAYRRVLMHAQAVVSQAEEMRELAVRGSDREGRPIAGPSKVSVPISVLSLKECESLIRSSTKAQDGQRALLTLEIMQRSGMPVPEKAITDTLEVLVAAGDVKASESLITNFITSPTEQQRHLHVKAHLKATPPHMMPTSALHVLHAYEEKALFAPMKTYTKCVATLLRSSSTLARAQGWDLFTHMRYVAHPDPDVFLYTQMIQACAYPFANSRTSEPEKALDFWTEMTVDRKLEPTIQTYNAIILACAKSGETIYVNEAYRLAKQMMDAFRDARGVSAFGPNKRTFTALLEGAKRVGDLGRARWILAEIVRNTGSGLGADENEEVSIDNEIMVHLFQAYASYRPPFKREATVVLQTENGSAHVQGEYSLTQIADISSTTDVPGPIDAASSAASTDSGTSTPLTLESIPAFSHIPPQSREEVLKEVAFLFQRILHDTGIIPIPPEHEQHHQDGPHSSSSLAGKFSNVEMTTRLLAAYMSVSFQHAPLALSEQMFWTVFDQLNVPRTARVYVEALDACAYVKSRCDKDVAEKFAEDLWVKWKEIEDSICEGDKALDARLIERAYAAKLRLHAKNNDVDKALHLVHSFVQRYPPSSVRTPPEKLNLRSTRTSLVGGSRPLVRMTSPVEVPDGSVPPLLTFKDLEVLHNRLIVFGRVEELGYLKWVCKAYAWMLRVRRDEAFKARPVKHSAESEPEGLVI